MSKHLCVAYAHARNIGYGRAGTDIAKALADLDVDVSDWVQGWEAHVEPVDQIEKPGRARTVVFVSPGTHIKGWFEGQRAVSYTMWEATELPEANRELLHEFDQIIVPSMENLKLYSRYHDNVKYVPLGVGPEWHYRPRDPIFPEQVGTDHQGNVGIPMSAPQFNFLCAGTSPRRKGIDLTAQAFRLAFPNALGMSPRPTLIYKSPYGAQVEGVDYYVEGFLSEQEEIELYQSAHCFVSLARGEGFGLQPLQAIAQGCPTILVDAHGHEAFANLGVGVPAELVPAPEEMGFGDAGEWWEADTWVAANTMRHVYKNYAQHVARAERNSALAHSQFSWGKTAEKLLEAVGPYLPEWIEGLETEGFDWHALEPMRYLVRVVAPYKGTVNGVAYTFEPGQGYYDVADIKRMVHRAGYLDPSCIGSDGVVNADPRLSGNHSYCPTCLQRLGSGIHKADDILAQMEQRATS